MTVQNGEFSDAVRLAFEAFRPYANHFRHSRQQTLLEPLLQYLRSEREIGQGDREFLADLLAGELGTTPGRPKLKLSEKIRRDDICVQVMSLEARWRKEGRKWPFHDEAIDEVSSSLLKGPKATHATADQIRSWFKGMKAEKRELLQRMISGN